MNNDCVTFYSKENCPPCVFLFDQFSKNYKGCYEKITLKSNEDAIKATERYSVKSVPFLVLADNTVLTGLDIYRFSKSI